MVENSSQTLFNFLPIERLKDHTKITLDPLLYKLLKGET